MHYALLCAHMHELGYNVTCDLMFVDELLLLGFFMQLAMQVMD